MTKRKTRSREGWTRVRFGDVVENVNDQPKRASLPLDTRYVAGEHVDENRLTIDRWGTLGDDLVPPTFKRRFAPRDVLFHSRNLKKIAVPDFGGITGEKLFVLRTRSPDLLQDFVPYILLSPAFTTYAEASWSGSVNKFLNWTPLAKYEFDLPPVEEQRQISCVCRAFAESKEADSYLIHATRAVHNSLRQQLFGVSCRPIPQDAKSTRLGEITTFFDSRRVPLSGIERSTRSGPYPYYGASGVIDHIDDYLFDDEKLLISEDGANLLARSTPIAFLASGKYWVNNHAHVVQARAPWTNFLLAEYLESIAIDGHVSGTAQPKLTRAACEAIRVPCLEPEHLARCETLLIATKDALSTAQSRVLMAVDPMYSVFGGRA